MGFLWYVFTLFLTNSIYKILIPFIILTCAHTSSNHIRTVRCKDEFEQNINAETVASMQGIQREQPQQIGNSNEEQAIDIWNDYCQLVDEISKNSAIGSDEKFQLFICLCLR